MPSRALGSRRFSLKEWRRAYEWMERNGLELYFFARLSALGIEGMMSSNLLKLFNEKKASNRYRIEDMFAELQKIEEQFTQSKLTYCVVKGASVVPEACPDLHLRRQYNLDFIMSRRESQKCYELLKSLGYVPYRITEHSWECERVPGKSKSSEVGEISEKHFLRIYFVSHDAPGVERSPYEMLLRRQWKTVHSVTFPALSASDHLIVMAIQIYGGASSGSLRLAWLLEFSTNVMHRSAAPVFWMELQKRADEHPLRPIAVAFAIRMASIVFKICPPEPIRSWLASNLDSMDDRWLSEYSYEVVCAGRWGTKLHHLRSKDSPSFQDDPTIRPWKLSALYPITIPAQVAARKSLKMWISRFCRIFSFLHFQVVEGIRYRRESYRWKAIRNELDDDGIACSQDLNW
jgi:hypothetical protein